MNVNNRWHVAGRSVRGATHVRAGLPNQDAIERWAADTLTPGQPACAAAVADGHGGHRHFRSDVGARFAVEIATRTMRSMARAIEQCAPAERASRLHGQLPAAIVGEWVASVRAHLAEQPIRDAEWTVLGEAEGDQAVESVRADPLLAYGATLLAALVTNSVVVLLQLGDGDVLAVATDGTTSRPVPSDERLNGNRTTSMCRPGAEDDFRIAVLSREVSDPALLLLSTDGYANSFRTDDDFLRVGSDFAALISKHGLTAVEGQLETILGEASVKGSGDDITLVLLQRDSAPFERFPESPGGASSNAITELSEANRKIARLRATLAAALIGVVALGAWIIYPQWHSHLPKVELGARPTAPISPVRDPGLSGSAPIGDVPSAGPGTAEPPKIGIKDGVTLGEGSGSMVAIQHAHAVRAERGIQISASMPLPAEEGNCTVRGAVFGAGAKELGAASAGLGTGSTAGELTLLVPYPTDKARMKAMRADASEFSLRVDCGGRAVAKTDRMAIDA